MLFRGSRHLTGISVRDINLGGLRSRWDLLGGAGDIQVVTLGSSLLVLGDSQRSLGKSSGQTCVNLSCAHGIRFPPNSMERTLCRWKIRHPAAQFGAFGLFLQEQPHEMGALSRKVVPCVARSPLPPGSTFLYCLGTQSLFVWGLKGKTWALCSGSVGGDVSFHISPREERWKLYSVP